MVKGEIYPAIRDVHILFVHVPKTAGMSLFNSLRTIFGAEKVIRFAQGSKDNQDNYLAMSDSELNAFNVISGHFQYPFFMKKKFENFKVITLVRDPIERELSAYFYMKTWKDHPQHRIVKKMNLFDYLDYRAKIGLNPQCRFISGEANFEAARNAIVQNYFLAAPVEYIPQFCTELETRLNLPHIAIKKENKTQFRLSPQEIHPFILERLEELSSEDRKIYEFIKNKFETEVIKRTG